MQRFEHCNAKSCAAEMLALGQVNMKMWYLFSWLTEHAELKNGTQAQLIKLYVNEQLVAYSLFENYQARADKKTQYQGQTYQDLGVVHFVTMPDHRKKGYASKLATLTYQNIIEPLLSAYNSQHNVQAYITATGQAVPLMQRTDIPVTQMITQFYSEMSFQEKVVNYLKGQASLKRML